MTQIPTLPAPPPLAPGTLRIVPLGGLGEVGRNMTVLELDGRLLVIDCGVLFPEDHQPGVDLILPDFDYIHDRLGAIEAVVLTHGHEDHIGAVPYLLRLRPDIPLIGSQLTLALVEAKLKEHRITPYSLTVREGQRERLGGFDCEFVAVNHSIPDALAVAVRTSAGLVLHTGDFKMDQLPLDGRLTDLRAFARLGDEGVDLFMVDSTNAEVPGFTTPERDIGQAMDRVFLAAQRRVIVACFSSHVHRVQQVLDAANAHGRKVALVGRSMLRNMGVARELGYLKVPDGVLVDAKALDDLPDDQVVLVCTGSQGEPMAALSRMANRDHRIEVGRGDTVVLASSLIPGNENAVFRVINGLTAPRRPRRAQGQRARARLRPRQRRRAPLLLQHRPPAQRDAGARRGAPPRGQRRPGRRHRRAPRAGRDRRRRHRGRPGRRGRDRRRGRPLRVRLRRRLGRGGDHRGAADRPADPARRGLHLDLRGRGLGHRQGRWPARTVQARGFVENDEVFSEVIPRIDEALAQAIETGVRDAYELQQVVRRVVGKWVGGKLRRRPMIIPVVIEA